MIDMGMPGYCLGLIGYPLQRSMSPRLHSAALEAMGLAGEYRLYPITPGPETYAELVVLLDRMRQGAIHGLNVTIPYKTVVRAAVDDETPTAHSIGAVNTILLQNGRLIGDNTDAPGFFTDLQQAFPQLNQGAAPGIQEALVLGAGGAARAVTFALAQAGWRVTVAVRNLDRAAAMIADLHALRPAFSLGICGLSAEKIRPRLPYLSLVVNATPVGMIPDVERSPWPEGLPLPPNACCYDLVYKPLETAFIRQVRDQGLPVVSGVGMLIEQAALALESWTGRQVPRQAMRLAADSAARSPARTQTEER